MHAGKAKAAKQKPEELDVDDFLNGGFMSVDAETDQQPESSQSEDDLSSAGDAALDSDADQDGISDAGIEPGADSESDGELAPHTEQAAPLHVVYAKHRCNRCCSCSTACVLVTISTSDLTVSPLACAFGE